MLLPPSTTTLVLLLSTFLSLASALPQDRVRKGAINPGFPPPMCFYWEPKLVGNIDCMDDLHLPGHALSGGGGCCTWNECNACAKQAERSKMFYDQQLQVALNERFRLEEGRWVPVEHEQGAS